MVLKHSVTLVSHVTMVVTSPASMHHTPTLKVSRQPHATSSVDHKICLGPRPTHYADCANLAHHTFCNGTC